MAHNKFSFIWILFTVLLSCNRLPDATVTESRIHIVPDYSGIVIPPNIAPLNFEIMEDGNSHIVHISGESKDEITIRSGNNSIQIPEKRWKRLLENNIGKQIHYKIYSRNGDGTWNSYPPFSNFVSHDSIDPYIAYRNIGSVNILWKEMSLVQRCLENFNQYTIMDNKLTDDNCMNCHSFNSNHPDQFMFHMRVPPSGTVIKNKDKLHFVNTATDHTLSAGVYPAWHPSGKYIAFSVNKINQSFHASTDKYVVVYDRMSDIVLLDLDKMMITTSPSITSLRLENLPAWSPDGDYMYYVSGTRYDENDYSASQYDLLRIPFDAETVQWGEIDTILTAESAGGSISFPRISPDGKWLVFVKLEYGYFSTYNQEADIYLMNLETFDYKKLEVNSEYVESYPVWSMNSRWIMFPSKRSHNMFSVPWFFHLDEEGQCSKEFMLPQKDPGFYKANISAFNRPEFISGKLDIHPREIYRLIKKGTEKVTFDTSIDLDAITGATVKSDPDSSFYFNQ